MKKINEFIINIFRKIINSVILFILYIVNKKPTKKSGVCIIKLEVLGDFILFLPTLKYYRKTYKNEKISLLVDNVLNRDIANRYLKIGLIDEIILLDSKKFSSNILYRFNFSKNLYKKDFLTAIYHVYYRRSIGDFLIQSTNATNKIGFKGYKFDQSGSDNSIKIYTKTVTIPPSISKEFDRNKYFIEKNSNILVDNFKPEFPINTTDYERADTLIEQFSIKTPYVIIFPGAGAEFRKWPADRFAKICDYLISKNILPVVCGSLGDKETTDKVINQTYSSKVIDLTDKTNIFTLGALIQNALFYFGSETGILHLAIAVQCPTLCIMGGGVIDVFFPYGDVDKNKAIFCEDMPCKNDGWKCAETVPKGSPAPCIEAISVDKVKNEINDFIEIIQNK